MKKKYIRITRSDVEGNYMIPKDLIASITEAEFDDLEYLNNGTQLILTVVEMEESEYEKLPEFMGW